MIKLPYDELTARNDAKYLVAEEIAKHLHSDFLLPRGVELEQTATLAFHTLCQRDDIEVVFDGVPKTDGRTIYLGTVDLLSPLAPIFVFGHGIHERNHVCYTDFKVFTECRSNLKHSLLNLFEDIRVDELAIRELSGYAIWRSSLFYVYDELKDAPWHDEGLSGLQLFYLYSLMFLQLNVLKIDSVSDIVDELRMRLSRELPVRFIEMFETLMLESFPLQSTREAESLSNKVAEILISIKDRNKERLEQLLHDEFTTSSTKYDDSIQGELFDVDGNAKCIPRSTPALKELKRIEKFFSITSSNCMKFEAFSASLEKLAELIRTDVDAGDDGSVTTFKNQKACDAGTWQCNFADINNESKRKFRYQYQFSNSLLGTLQAALRHRVAGLCSLDRQGLLLNDRELYRVACNDSMVFSRQRRQNGRRVRVQLLLDNSSSMYGSWYAKAEVLAIRLYEAFLSLSNATVDLAIFPGANGCGITLANERQEPVSKVIERIETSYSAGGTPIAQALLWSASRFPSDDCERLIFVITDGAFNEEKVSRLIRSLSAKRVCVAMLGVSSDSTPVGKYSAKVADLEQAPTKIAEILLKWRKDTQVNL